MPIIPMPTYKFLYYHDVLLYTISKVLECKSNNYPLTIILLLYSLDYMIT